MKSNESRKTNQKEFPSDIIWIIDNFAKYVPLFKQVQADIASGKRQLRPFKNYEILLHHFYVLKG